MKLAVTHTLTVDLGTPQRAVEHLLLTPAPTPQQAIERWSIAMPGFAGAAAFGDGFGNLAHLVSQARPGGPLTAIASGVVETIDRAGMLGRLPHEPPPGVFRRAVEPVALDAALLDGLDESGGRLAMLHALMGRLHGPAQTQTQTQDGQGQAQGGDPARFVAAARRLGVPARPVGGYLWGSGGARPHVWAEAWDDGLGWIGFDPALNLCPAETHIRRAAGLELVDLVALRAVPAPLGLTEQVEITPAP